MSFLVGAATITLELVVTAQGLGVAEVPQAAGDGCVLKFTKSTGGVSLKKSDRRISWGNIGHLLCE